MNVIEKVHSFIDSLEERTFYLYLAGYIGILLALSGLIIFIHYNKLDTLNERIMAVTQQRMEVKRLLTKYEQVKRQRREVDTLMAEDPGFKIGGYFSSVLAKLGLHDKRTKTDEFAQVEHEGKYQETILKTQLTDMNMRQLCELLNELEQNKKIYTKELEIAKSKKNPKVLDISLTIAALEPKT